jgi:ABC-type sugar transport system ATPase subunit
MSKILLTMEGIQKSFSGVMALKQVSLQVEQRSIHALVGESGRFSGKSPHGV